MGIVEKGGKYRSRKKRMAAPHASLYSEPSLQCHDKNAYTSRNLPYMICGIGGVLFGLRLSTKDTYLVFDDV